MAGRERSNGHSPEIMAPAGTYDLLNSIEGGILGSHFTTYTVMVIPSEDNSSQLEVTVKVKRPRQVSPVTVYTFKISPEDKVEGLRVQLRRLDPLKAIPLPIPEFSEVLGKIQTAFNISSTLQRQPASRQV